MDKKDLLKRKEFALSLCKEVNSYIKNIDRIDINVKAKNDFVTIHDKYVEDFLVSKLSKEFKEDGFLGEEGSYDNTNKTGFWVIDPIDGTHNFSRNLYPYCISLAYQKEMGKPLLALVWVFEKETYYWAIKDLGSYEKEKRIFVSTTNDKSLVLVSSAFPMRHKSYYKKYEKNFKRVFDQISDVRRSGSAAYDLCMVAKASTDCYFEFFTGYYDIAAGMLIVSEAGGLVSSIDNKEFVFGEFCNIIASNKNLHSFFKENISGE